MGFADELAALPAKRKGPQCTAGKVAEAMDPTDRAEFEAALVDDTVRFGQVREVLARRGIEVGEPVLSRHARRLRASPPWEAPECKWGRRN